MNDLVRRLREHDGHLGFLVEEAADEIERLRETIRLFLGAAYPMATEINARGYNWSEAYLDQARAHAVEQKNGD